MSIFFPYNEILPKKRAHAIYLVFSVYYFAKHGEPTALIYGGKKSEIHKIKDFYNLANEKNLFLDPTFHIRKNNPLNMSWNRPFFYLCQKKIEKQKPNIVITSVFKQAKYHIERKSPATHYVYEIHELSTYPGQCPTDKTRIEKKMLADHDLIVTTTSQLKSILQEKPYSLTNPIAVVPLATHAKPLGPPQFFDLLNLFYIGSLEPEQGVQNVIRALSQTTNSHLTLIGGTSEQIAFLKNLGRNLGIEQRLDFLGFQLPSSLQALVEKADAFIAPFTNEGKMAYVAHTKLADYTAWGRPLIAPNLPVVKEHVDPNTFFFEDINSLAAAIQKVASPHVRKEWHLKKSHFDLSWDTRTKNYLKILNDHFQYP